MSDRNGISPNILNLLNSLDYPVSTTYRDQWKLRQEEMAALSAQPEPIAEEESRSWGDVIPDAAKSLAKTVNSLGGTAVQTVDAAGRMLSTIDPIGQTVAYLAPEFTAKTNAAYDSAVDSSGDFFADNQDYWEEQKSQKTQEDAKYVAGGDGFVDTVKRVAERPQTIPNAILDSAAYMVPGAWVARAMTAAKASAAAVATGSMATGAVLDAGATGAQTKREVLDMTPAQLIEHSPDYKQMINEGVEPAAAQAALARSAGFTAQALQLPISFLASKVTGAGKLESDFFTGNGVRDFFSTVAKEVGEEAVQEGAAQANQNAGVKLYADEHRDIARGVGNSAALGAATGGVQGGGMKALSALVPRATDKGDDSGIDQPINGEQAAVSVPANPIAHTGDPSNPDDKYKFELDQTSFVSGLRARIDARRAEAARAAATAEMNAPDTDLASAARSYGQQQGFIQPAPAVPAPDLASIEETPLPADLPPSLGELPAAANQFSNEQQKASAEQDAQRFQAEFDARTADLDAEEIPFAAARAIGARRRDAEIDRVRNSRMPENMRDVRLLRSRFREHLDNVRNSLDANADALGDIDSLLQFAAKNGGLNAKAWGQEGVDPGDASSINKGAFHKVFRIEGGMTPDDLAELAAQNGFRGFADSQGTPDANAALNAVNDELGGSKQYFSAENEEKLQAVQAAPGYISELKGYGSPRAIKAAVDNALAGKKLGVNQIRIVQEILENANTHTRNDTAIREKWEDRAKTIMANRGNKHLDDWRNRDEHDVDVTTHEAALNEVMADAVERYGIDPDKIHAAYEKYHAKYPNMNQFVVAMKSWVSANNQQSSGQHNEQQTELPRGPSGEPGAPAARVEVPPASQSNQAAAAQSRPEGPAPGERRSVEQGRDSRLRQSVSSELPQLKDGWDKSLINARPIAKSLGIPNYTQLRLADLVPVINTRYKTNDAKVEPVASPSIEGRDIDGNWAEFSAESGTLAIPRAEMPQIKAEHRGAMVNFLNARGIAHEEDTVPASDLKPTQSEFSREKVAKAKDFKGGSRSILISSDNHVLDGHHQWMAARDKGEDVKVIRLDSPIKDLLNVAHEFPSSTTDSTSETEKNTAGDLLYSLGDDSDTVASSVSSTVSQHDADKVIVRIRSGLVDKRVQIKAVRDFSEFPAAVKRHADQQGHDGSDVKGVFHDGSIYLNRSAIDDSADVERVVLHELYGHYGLRALFGKEIKQNMMRLYLAVGGSRAIRDIALKHGHNLDKYEAALKDYPRDTYTAVMAEELLAHIAQDNKPSVKRLMKELIGALRNWLRTKGFLQLSAVSESELYHILKLARKAAINPSGKTGSKGTAFGLQNDSAGAGGEDAMYSLGSAVASKTPILRERLRREQETESLPTNLQKSYRGLGQNKSVVDRVLSEVKRQLTPAGLLPREVFDLKVARDGEMNADELHTKHTLRGFYDSVKAAYGMEYHQLKAGTKREINKVLRGEPDAKLAPSVKISLDRMRDDIKRLSAVHVKQLLADAAEAEAQEKTAEAESKLRMVETISANFDTYLHRSYRAFDDKDWPNKVPAKVYENAVNFLASEYAKGGPVNSDHIKLAEKRVHMILQEGTAFDSMGAFITESKLGAKDLSIMKKRKEVPEPIRALLGEYEDAAMNYTKSVTKMSRLVHNHAFLISMKQVAFDLGLLHEKQNLELGATKKIAGDSTDSYAPLNGLYTTREFEQALKDALGKTQPNAIYDAIVAANGMVKFGKTVLSPTTAMRNLTSSMFFALTNGHFDVRQFAKSAEVMRVYFADKGPEATKQYMEKLRRLGVIYDSPMAGEMMDLLKDARLENTLMNSGNPLLNGTKSALEWAQKFYSAGDDIYKVMGFENEKAMLMKHKKMSEADAEIEAAERIRNTYPTYSMIGRGVNTLRRFPLVGAFVSFPAEIIRTSYNITGYLYQDAKELGITNPMVMRKLIGYAIAAGAIGALQALSAAWQGVDDEEEKALRLMAPQFSKNSNYLWLWRDEKGNRRYVDLSFLDPYNYWKRPINAVLQDQPVGEALQSGASDLLSPFFGWDIAAKAIGETVFNQKSSGGEVFNPADGAGAIAEDIGKHLGKALQPGVFVNIENFYMALAGQQSKSGKVYNLADETAALLGWRAATFDPKVALFYQSYSYQDAKSNASKILKAVVSDNNQVDPAAIRDAYKNSMEARKQAFEDMEAIVSSAKKTGLTNLQIIGVLRDSGTSLADARALVSGKPPVFTQSKTMLKSAIKKASVLFDEQTQKEMKVREKLINDLNRDARAGRLSYVDE